MGMEKSERETDKFGYINFISIVFDIDMHVCLLWWAICAISKLTSLFCSSCDFQIVTYMSCLLPEL